ncbi:MAG TPA: LysE family transporter, partial [Ktedonobacterales bacterium]
MDLADLIWVAKGLLLGFAIAAPVGPIGVLCIRRSLAEGWLTGFLTGMGAATADGFYGGVAAFGLTAISGVLVAQQGIIRVVGGVLLCYLG